MASFPRGMLWTILSALALVRAQDSCGAPSPTVQLDNGTYIGVHNDHYNQDVFLGIPYAQPPVESLRFAAPQPLTEAFDQPRPATEYGNLCIGYGSDTEGIDAPVSEDCLTLNVVRPAGSKPGDDLPVGVWVHGGVSDCPVRYMPCI